MKPSASHLLRASGLVGIIAFIVAAVSMRAPSYHERIADYVQRGEVVMDSSIQTILEEEMQQTVNANFPKWAGALVLDVPSGVVIATYSSDSVNRLRDTIDLGSISMPLQLLDAIQNHHLSPYATADIHKEGVIIDSVRYVDNHPRDTTLDIPGIIATSSHVGAAILLSQCNPDSHGYIFKRKTTMMDVADDYCRIADDINRPLHDRNMDMIQQGLHKVVWDNNIGTASVRQWDGRIMAYKAQSDSIHIAGKTGSAQIYRDGLYHSNEHRISFIGYFPEEAPRYCCLVVIDSPSNYPLYDAGYDCGGTVRRIAERIYLHQ